MAKGRHVGEQSENRKRLLNLDGPNTYLLLERTDLFLSFHLAELIKLLLPEHPIITAG